MGLDRRNLLAGAGAVAGLTSSLPVLAEDQHAGHGTHTGHDVPEGGEYEAVQEASAGCVAAGQNCLRYCLDSFAAGDTSMAACAKSVRQMLAVTAALQDLAAADSGYVPAFAREARTVCLECERECRKHAEHHAVCRACGEACNKAAAEYEKVAA